MERPPSLGSAENEKGVAWQLKLQELESVGDKLGYRIDPGIKETVAAFMLNEFPTYGSCEGHLEERDGKVRKLHPYIAVGFDEPSKRYVGEAEIKQRIADQFHIAPDEIEDHENAMQAYWDYIQDHEIEETGEFQIVRAKNEALGKQFAELLEEFYKEREKPAERPLAIHGIGPAGHFYVEDATENPKEDIPEEETEKLRDQLAKEQAEMGTLTEFLRRRYLTGSS